VQKRDYARLNYFDLWLPDLAPSAALMSWLKAEPITGGRWQEFARRYQKEMRSPSAARLIQLLALLSHSTSFSIGCYCEDETRCHRSLLRVLLDEAGAALER
jgi:uncharacterized protein YeaO (DUF488 family)